MLLCRVVCLPMYQLQITLGRYLNGPVMQLQPGIYPQLRLLYSHFPISHHVVYSIMNTTWKSLRKRIQNQEKVLFHSYGRYIPCIYIILMVVIYKYTSIYNVCIVCKFLCNVIFFGSEQQEKYCFFLIMYSLLNIKYYLCLYIHMMSILYLYFLKIFISTQHHYQPIYNAFI